VDGIRTLHTPNSEAHEDWKREAYAYTEMVPIELSCTTKAGITGDKLRWKMESDLRNTFETYPLGSVRTLERVRVEDRNMGIWKLNSVLYDLRYKRAVEDYTSDVAISYGTGYIYDCDTTTDWTLNVNGSDATASATNWHGYLTLNIETFVGDVEFVNDNNIARSTTVYPRIRFRYITSGGIKAKIVLEFSDASTQTVLSETESTSFSVVDVAMTAAKQLDHISIYGCDVEGSVFVDWIYIYGGDFDFPNATNIIYEPSSRNTFLGIPNRVTSIPQNLGADPTPIEIICDLDIETDDYSWKRAGDVDNGDVFLDILHNQSLLGPWQWLTWGNKAMRVVLDSARVEEYDGRLHIRGHEYSDSNKRDEYYYQRFGLA